MGPKPILHPRYVGAAGLALYLGATAGAPATILGFAFLGWRCLGWEHFGGKMDPGTPRQIFGLFMVHTAMIPLLTVAAAVLHRSPLVAGLAGLGFAYVAALLGHTLWAYEQRGRDVNAWIEAARGFALGVAFALVLM